MLSMVIDGGFLAGLVDYIKNICRQQIILMYGSDQPLSISFNLNFKFFRPWLNGMVTGLMQDLLDQDKQ